MKQFSCTRLYLGLTLVNLASSQLTESFQRNTESLLVQGDKRVLSRFLDGDNSMAEESKLKTLRVSEGGEGVWNRFLNLDSEKESTLKESKFQPLEDGAALWDRFVNLDPQNTKESMQEKLELQQLEDETDILEEFRHLNVAVVILSMSLSMPFKKHRNMMHMNMKHMNMKHMNMNMMNMNMKPRPL